MPDLNLTELHTAALATTRNVVVGIASTQWHRPTPCAEWDVRMLANHVVAGNWWAAQLASGATISDVGTRLDGDVLGVDPRGSYDSSADAAIAAFERDGAMDAPCAVSYGPVPGSVYCGHRFVDVLVHGWDLAVATNQPTELDAALVAACLELVRPEAAMLAASGAFGHARSMPGGDPQTALLMMLGRTP